jgi:hypothetical protein
MVAWKVGEWEHVMVEKMVYRGAVVMAQKTVGQSEWQRVDKTAVDLAAQMVVCSAALKAVG